MMRDIKSEFARYAPEVWRREMQAPHFLQRSLTCWLKTFDDFKSFALRECEEIHALFEDNELALCVYFENKSVPESLTVHLSVLGEFDRKKAVKEICALRDIQFRQGVKKVDGWILERNFGLKKMVTEIGFMPTELTMRCGTAHGKSLRWRLYRITRV